MDDLDYSNRRDGDEMGMVFEIFRSSLNDGPGVRTTVFLKGCPLRCKWCHNPESHSIKKQLFYMDGKCIGCRACMNACENNCHIIEDNEHRINYSECVNCGKCVDECTQNALVIKGKEMTASEVIEYAIRDKGYYAATGGGITVSGGEPLFQPEFTYEILKMAIYNGIHTCVETSGFSDEKTFQKVTNIADLVLMDCKGIDDNKHMKNTGVSNKLITENMKYLQRIEKPVILRCPLIPGVNDSDKDLELLASYADEISCVIHVEIMPYHNYGLSKIACFQNDIEMFYRDNASENDKERWQRILRSNMNKKVIIS
jgi:glycyl-radical enzyme activating protein